LPFFELRESEIQHLEPAVVADHRVRWLQIPMRDAPVMRGAHGVGEGNHELE
jgi:hypothetical protein